MLDGGLDDWLTREPEKLDSVRQSRGRSDLLPARRLEFVVGQSGCCQVDRRAAARDASLFGSVLEVTVQLPDLRAVQAGRKIGAANDHFMQVPIPPAPAIFLPSYSTRDWLGDRGSPDRNPANPIRPRSVRSRATQLRRETATRVSRVTQFPDPHRETQWYVEAYPSLPKGRRLDGQ